MSFRRARRIAVRHRGDADGVNKVACGKGGAFYANEGGLTKRKSPPGQQLPREFDLWDNARFGPKGSASRSFYRAAGGCGSVGGDPLLRAMAMVSSRSSARSSSDNSPLSRSSWYRRSVGSSASALMAAAN